MSQTILHNKSRIIIFDGVCNFCSASLMFIYKRDKEGLFKFSTVQSPKGKTLLQLYDLPTDDYESLVYIDYGQPYYKSDAILKIASYLPWPWPAARILKVIPRIIRDSCYDVIAKNRYKIRGKRKRCMLPTGDLMSRFI